MKLLIGDAPLWLCEALSENGFEVFKTGLCDLLPGPVSGHIDLVAVKILDKLFIAQEKEKTITEYDRMYSLFSGYDIRICKTKLSDSYPGDVPLNFVTVGDYVICNPRTVLPDALYIAKEYGKTVIPVSQGYTNCSTLVIDEKSIITDDEGIFKACSEFLDVLLVEKGSISLPGYDYGFIGGSAFRQGDTVYFFGNLFSHPDSEKIEAFIREKILKVCSLSFEHKLVDIGGTVVL